MKKRSVFQITLLLLVALWILALPAFADDVSTTPEAIIEGVGRDAMEDYLSRMVNHDAFPYSKWPESYGIDEARFLLIPGANTSFVETAGEENADLWDDRLFSMYPALALAIVDKDTDGLLASLVLQYSHENGCYEIDGIWHTDVFYDAEEITALCEAELGMSPDTITPILMLFGAQEKLFLMLGGSETYLYDYNHVFGTAGNDLFYSPAEFAKEYKAQKENRTNSFWDSFFRTGNFILLRLILFLVILPIGIIVAILVTVRIIRKKKKRA